MRYCVCILFLIYILLKLHYNKNKLDISSFFELYWFVFVSMGLLVFDDEYPISILTIVWIFCACILFGLGYNLGKKCILGRRNIIRETNIVTLRDYSLRIYSFVVVSFLITIFFKLAIITLSGNLSSLFSFSRMLDMFSSFREIKYGIGEAAVSTGFLGKIVDLIYYPTIIVLGCFYKQFSKTKKKKIIVLFLGAVLLSTLTDGAKASIIFALVLFLVGIMLDAMYMGGYQLNKINYKMVFLIAITFFMVMKILLHNNVSSFLLYGFGEIPAFDEFFNRFDGNYTYGKQTFYGIVRNLNSDIMFDAGNQNYSLPVTINIATNVYTAFRCSITDYGYLGALIFYIIMGFSAGLCVNSKRKGYLSMSILGWIMGYIMLSFLISVSYYLTITLAFLIFPIYIQIFARLYIGDKNT